MCLEEKKIIITKEGGKTKLFFRILCFFDFQSKAFKRKPSKLRTNVTKNPLQIAKQIYTNLTDFPTIFPDIVDESVGSH